MRWLLRAFLNWLNGPGCAEVVPISCSVAGHKWSGGAARHGDDEPWIAWYKCNRCGAVTREHDPDDFLVIHPAVTKRHLEKTEMG